MIIQHNMSAINTMTQLGITNANLKKSAERLSSGYRINRAADDAAKLSISEKKRSQVRGLLRAAKNAEEGVNFVQTADGALGEMENLLHRMRELTIQSLNDVYTDDDRAAMQMEFDELQREIDRMNEQTEFNTLNVFEKYSDTYFTFEGNRVWSQDQIHKIDDTNQSLTIKYKVSEDEAEKEITLSVPKGEYTTQELIDEMDDVVTALGDVADGISLEYTEENCCNMVIQEGEEIAEITGGLSYLFFDEFEGSQVGSLIGTTVFDPNFPLIINEKNNELKFTIENFDNTTQKVDLKIASGYYTREDMINYLNTALAGTGMTASEYGDYSIQIGGEDGIITGLKGNMFKIDEKGEQVMVSVFYDNTKYGKVEKTPAVFTGGAVLVSRSTDTECNRFKIDDTNNKLMIRVNGTDGDEYKEITLTSGEYTIGGMVTELQSQLDAAGVDVEVSQYGPQRSSSYTINGNRYSFYGLRLTSNLEGEDSKIEFDVANSSAYDTLFVKRTYTDEGDDMNITLGKYSYTKPKMTGGKVFTDDDFPLTLDATNNSFKIKLTEEVPSGASTSTSSKTYAISLTEKSYSSVDEIISEINEQLNGATGALIGVKGKVQAINSSNAIAIVPMDDNRSVTRIAFGDSTVAPYSGGYEELFVGKNIEYSTSKISSTGTAPSIKLDNLTEPINIDDTNNTLKVTVAGEDREVVLPTKQYTKDELAAEITEQLKGGVSTYTNSFSGYGTGTTTNKNKSYSVVGSDNRVTINCNVTGSGGAQDGTTTVVNGKPATYTVPVSLPSNKTITVDNNQLMIQVNGTNYDILLDVGDYTPSQLAQEIQSKLDEKITTGANKVNVTLDGNKLVFTTEGKGSAMSLSFGANTSSFLEDISTNKTAATLTLSSNPLQSQIVIDSSNNIFAITVDGRRHTLSLDAGTYGRTDFVSQLNQKLQGADVGVTASLSGSYLKFVTDEANGSASSIKYNTADGGNSAAAIFGELVLETPAKATLSTPLKENISIRSGENQFKIRLTENGSSKDLTVNIPEKDYTREELVQVLNNGFSGEVKVTMNTSGQLTFTTIAEGSDVSVRVNNSISGSAAKAMFGETTVKKPDVTASFDSAGNLILTGEASLSRYTLSAQPSLDSALLKPEATTKTVKPTATNGDVVLAYYKMTTQKTLPTNTTISSYNKDFHFLYNYPGGQTSVDIVLDEKDYSQAELQDVLQEKIDAVLGTGALKVQISSSKLSITAENYGSEYSMTSMSGGFYEYVMRGTAVRGADEVPTNVNGKQQISDTYIIGRKDVRNSISNIKKDVNDVLALDVTIDNTVYTLSVTINPGSYDATALVNEIQSKLDEQVKSVGLPEKSVLVGVGKFDSGVVGADDKNALNIYLNPDADLIEGDYRIDGLTGSALFEIFYKTTGDLIPAYITGTKDITNGVEIEPGKTDFSLEVDGITYEYTIPEGAYTCDEFLEKMNELFEAPDNNGNKALIEAVLSGDALKISYKKVGKHTLKNVQGAAKPELFYATSGRKDYDSSLNLQIGANTSQATDLKRFSMSTLNMGINSVTVSKYKYAEKALVRVDGAMEYLNSARSVYGANQNRLEYTIKGNENTAENTQSSESRDRDADMAEEIVQYSKGKILEQTGVAVLAQANQHTQAVLGLLR